jgi:hypothetical protein
MNMANMVCNVCELRQKETRDTDEVIYSNDGYEC